MSHTGRRPIPFTQVSGLLLILALLLFFETQRRPQPAPPAPTPLVSAWYSLHFTQPVPGFETLRLGGPTQAVVDSIGSAAASVEVAVYDLDLLPVVEAMTAAVQRGVVVRVVVESDNRLEPALIGLEEAGITILGDRREGLMHHKYVVVDGRWVWTGSMNLTGNDTVRNDNNFLMIDSRDLAANYQQEFEEMWQDRFGADSLRDTPNPEVIVNGVTITSAFAPDDGVAGRLIDALRSARTSIEFLAFSFTSDPIADAMLERAGEGVAVRGVMEASQAAGSGSELERLRAAGLDVRRDGNPGNMHHKVILIDRSIVVTGSYNFSQSAETRNDENVLILRDPALAEAFEAEFERVFAMAVP